MATWIRFVIWMIIGNNRNLVLFDSDFLFKFVINGFHV